MSALFPALGERDWRGEDGQGELSDIRAVLQTATAALEEIRNQVCHEREAVPIAVVLCYKFVWVSVLMCGCQSKWIWSVCCVVCLVFFVFCV